MFGHLPIVKQLVAAGCDCTAKNLDGCTALQLARQQKFATVYQYLKERDQQQVTVGSGNNGPGGGYKRSVSINPNTSGTVKGTGGGAGVGGLPPKTAASSVAITS
uniref:ANK_REP_REGION domain-containing protein n=1 Tax=Anopheles atroparvus TaxID=41427 RepID=A0A182JEB2_ANOAO